MKMLSVKALSPAVMSRIRNGHKVRLMKGEGTQLVVHENQWDAINHAFLKNKGVQIALSPAEVDANKSVEGMGIFGKKFDKALKKAGVKKVVYKMGAVVKPLVDEAIDKGAMAATMFAPQLAPAIEAAQATAKQYLDKPQSLQGKKGVAELKKRALKAGLDVAAPLAAAQGVDINELKTMMESGSQMPMSKREMMAKGEDAVLSKLQSMVDKRRASSAPTPYDIMDTDGIIGNGMRGKMMAKGGKCCPMCSGSGLYAGAASGRGFLGPARDTGKKFVALSKKLMGGELQALQSQAADANFAFRYTLPPAYQR
jgi:hypothetical protein